MKLKAVHVRDIGQIPGQEGVEERAFMVHVDLEITLGEEPLGLGVKMTADVPYDQSLTYEQIAERGVARARQLLSNVSTMDEEQWLKLYRLSLEPTKPFSFSE
ncbi:hypothetical protein FJ981_28110 [Mesorhizobium sp. B1-1-4]|uniref:hypothetical protein n=1 Tax=Mesorhizobium sp. B1-1-4 TaxID=2589980 RepID=UPI00112D8BCF|nr:hypothetical protein [Mesorhizobium sp. B1-1-4]TPN44463.1 hypothetical protein FJ981_28110 [Mesorhizobium sp. B1-1-4]